MRTRASVVRPVIALLVLCTGCAPIQVEVVEEVTPLSRRVEKRPADRWSYAARVDARKNAGGGVTLTVASQRWHQCDVEEISESRRRRTVVRTNTAPAGTALVAILGLGGAGLLYAGLVRHRDGEPFSKTTDDKSELTTGGAMIVYGSALSSLLLFTVYNVFAAIDSSTDLGPSVTSEHRSQACDAQPAGDIPVTLAIHNRTIAGARTDAQGKATLTAQASALANASDTSDSSIEMKVGGQAIALDESVRNLVGVPRVAETAGAPPPAVRGDGSESLLLPVRSAQPPGHLELAHVPLKGALRADLEAAVRHAGARPIVGGTTDSVYLSRFELAASSPASATASRAMAGLSVLELIFDDQDRFIAATLSNPRAPTGPGPEAKMSQGALIEALRLRYGLPQMKNGASQDQARPTWTFADGVEIAYVPGSAAGKPAKVVVLDVAAQRALSTGGAHPQSAGGEHD